MQITPIPSMSRCRLWHVDLDVAADAHAVRAEAALSEAEWERARRFVFKRDRERFVAAHAALREVLGGHSGIPAAMLEFTQGEFGKPHLVQPRLLHFNLSHSQSMALISVCDEAATGVDIELLREMPDADDLARTYFSAAECEALVALRAREGDAARDRAFLTCWTRKEACLKAMGMGLSLDTRKVEVGIVGDEREVRICTGDSATRLALGSFDDVAGALCAVARVLSHIQTGPATTGRRPAQEQEICA